MLFALWDTLTYGELAQRVADHLGKERMSARAVGTAAGKNPLPILIPCHRVVGSHVTLGGYTLNPAYKEWLLDLEKG